jgi:curved DNA-binding protein CbpA
LRKVEPKPAPVVLPVETPDVSDEDLILEVDGPAREITLEEYLTLVEEAESYYEMLRIDLKATAEEVKTAYFNFAKRFHPDKFHKESDPKTVQRIQDAFSEIARGYETLKAKETRDVYDFKLRKHLETLKTAQPAVAQATEANQTAADPNDAAKQFQRGLDLFMNGDFAESVTFFARAVSMVPGSARYHAYYGKALSKDETQRRKSESELQTAINLDPSSDAYRIMLAEFYIQYGLHKRAEGELQRLLAKFPDHKEALSLLDSLAVKS